MGLGRLCGHRHHPADRRRVAVRGGRPRAGARVLDVACGNGNATLAAARRFCKVTGLDYVPALLRRAAERARAEHLAIQLRGRRRRTPALRRRELRRGALDLRRDVRARPSSRPRASCCGCAGPAAASAWPTGRPRASSASCSRRWASTSRPRPGCRRPLWGTEAPAAASCSGTARPIQAERKVFVFRYQSAEHFIDVFRRFYGPTHKAFEALDAAGPGAAGRATSPRWRPVQPAVDLVRGPGRIPRGGHRALMPRPGCAWLS